MYNIFETSNIYRFLCRPNAFYISWGETTTNNNNNVLTFIYKFIVWEKGECFFLYLPPKNFF
jgi:hypothetical protein